MQADKTKTKKKNVAVYLPSRFRYAPRLEQYSIASKYLNKTENSKVKKRTNKCQNEDTKRVWSSCVRSFSSSLMKMPTTRKHNAFSLVKKS